MAFQLHHLHPAISRGGLTGALQPRLSGRHRCDAPQPLQAGGYVGVSCVENKVDTLESLRDLSRWLRARRWDVGIRDQTNFHDTYRVRIELRRCIGFKPCEPWLFDTLVVPQEFESRVLGQLLVKVSVADVQIFDCLKACPY